MDKTGHKGEKWVSRQQKIGELTQKLSVLKDQRDKLNTEADEWAEKRDKLNEQFKNLRAETLGLKNERDKLNEEVKELKRQRDEAKTEFHAKIGEIRKLNQGIKALIEKKPSKTFQALQTEFDRIEWKIQTTTLSLNEEKELVEQVKQLETRLNIYKKLNQQNQKLVESKAELTALKTKGKLFHEQLTETALRSQQIHEKMMEKINNSKKLKEEADSLHRLFLQTREKVRPIHKEIIEISDRIRKLREEAQKEEEKEKRKSEDTLRQKLEKQAREKLRRGEKLSWEEFQLLGEKGMAAQD